jgi:alpha-glucosidase
MVAGASPGSPPRGRWWEGGTVYHVYVRSFRDSNADGYGDLRGVIAGLDHLAWLGVDAIWLSPTMPSPDHDWGYDVADYLGVHPELGTLADLGDLIAQAGRRGIRVLLDLVPNHTSSEHPWFAEARSGRGSPRRGWYVWADPAPGGGPPNNWRDPSGGPAWTSDEASGQYYLHNYLPGQPDLNWWEPAVGEEFRRILRFWFGRGVAGVRIDVAHGLYKDALLRDNPPLAGSSPLDGRFGLRAAYSANRPEVHEVYRDWRRLAESYQPPRLLLGETWVGELDRLAAFYGRDDELHLALNMPFQFTDFTAGSLAGMVAVTLAHLPAGACPVWAASSHDAGRFPSRWCGGDEAKARLALLVLATLPGTLVLYYGDEIAMTDTEVPRELRRDRMTWDQPAGRDRCRTPLPWDDSPGAGFTAPGVRPWLPLGEHATRNIASQRRHTGSVLWLCRRLLALRRCELGGRVAGYRQIPAPPGVWCYQSGPLLVAANFTGSQAELRLPEPGGRVVLSTRPRRRAVPGMLGPWEGVVIRPAA